ncbi:MAG: Fur family transcriptional regulator [Helicobacteraceae bacterium]
MTHFENILKQHNLKATHQRLVILDEINSAGHIDLDSLFEKIKKKFPTMALATLYRNLSDMVSKRILTEVKTQKSKNVYELTKKEHAHLICNKCKKIEDYPLESDALKGFFLKIDGKISGIELNINYVCKDCLEKH